MCGHFNRHFLKFCFLYMIVQGNSNMSGFCRKIPKGTHLHLSTGLPGIFQIETLGFCFLVLLSLLPCLLFLTSPSANSPLSNGSAFENHVFRKSCWKLLPNHLLFSFKCPNISSTSISFCSCL